MLSNTVRPLSKLREPVTRVSSTLKCNGLKTVRLGMVATGRKV